MGLPTQPLLFHMCRCRPRPPPGYGIINDVVPPADGHLHASGIPFSSHRRAGAAHECRNNSCKLRAQSAGVEAEELPQCDRARVPAPAAPRVCNTALCLRVQGMAGGDSLLQV
jgi:hypothetical protein